MSPVPSMDKMVQEMLWHVDAACEEAGWDRNAELYAIMLVPDAIDIPVEGGLATGVAELRPVPGWDLCLEKTENPTKALSALAYVMSKAPADMIAATFPKGELYGFFLVTEAWMLRAKETNDIDAEWEQMSYLGHVHEHPDRIEVRFIYCVSVDGTVATLSHERDSIAETLEDHAIDGNIPDLLTKIVKVVNQK